MDDKTILGTIVATVLAIPLVVPKIMNMFKSDKLDGGSLDRLAKAEEHISELRKQVSQQNLELTDAQMMLIQVHSIMNQHDTPIPENVTTYITKLKEKFV